MNIEEELFKRSKIDFNKIIKYGFRKEQNKYIYSKNIMNNTFKVNIEIDNQENIKGSIYDLTTDEEYINYRIKNSTGSFVDKVRDEFKNILNDIKDKCCINKYFTYEQSNRITKLIKQKYGDEPEFEWKKFPMYATFKNKDSNKWYGIIMNIDKCKLNNKLYGEIEIINLKLESKKIENLLNQDGYYPAYHMNKKYWITIVLDDTISDYDIMNLIEESYSYTVINNTNEWLVPANPKYFDIESYINKSNIITWKQSTNIKVNDIVYLYVASPYSSIMYKFKVIKVNIPYTYKDKNIKMNNTMQMELLEKYEKGKYSFDKIKEFGVNAIKCQRYMPLNLSKYINN